MPPSSERICLLDDEPSVLKAVGRLLASEGLQAEKFRDSERFLEYVRSCPVRLAVIDLRMAGMDGLEVLAKLRAISPETKAIIMTGENEPANRTAALAGGASAFFLKPFNDAAFLTAVRDAMVS